MTKPETTTPNNTATETTTPNKTATTPNNTTSLYVYIILLIIIISISFIICIIKLPGNKIMIPILIASLIAIGAMLIIIFVMKDDTDKNSNEDTARSIGSMIAVIFVSVLLTLPIAYFSNNVNSLFFK